MDHCMGCHTCAFTQLHMLFCESESAVKVFHIRRKTRVGASPSLPIFLKSKKCPDLGKKGTDFVYP